MNDRKTKTTQKRLGRPPGPPDSIRPHRVVTFVTESELRLLREIADASGNRVKLPLVQAE